MTQDPSRRISDYLSGERTMLAWVRTGLALMGFGFVVARFGLFLRELAKAGFNVSSKTGMSLWIGVGLVCLGVTTIAFSTFKHHAGISRLNSGEEYSKIINGKFIWFVSTAIILFGIAMVYYLISLRSL